jgi:PAS domain S-box-containing protein
MFCVARDSRKTLNKRKNAQERRFKALVQEGYDLIGILDAEETILYVSPTSTAILGITPEEFIGRNALEFVHQDDVESTLASLQK